MSFLVYEVWDLSESKPIYVGKATDLDARREQHLKYMRKVRNGPAFHKILRKMLAEGRPHEYRCVFETESEDSAFAEERRRIALYGRRDLGTGCLWNLTDGGEGMSGWRAPDDVRRRWSEIRKGRVPPNKGKSYKHGVVSPKKGKPWSEKQRAEFDSRSAEKRAITRERHSAALKGKPRSEKHVAADAIRAAKMTGASNPNFGKVGSWAGKVGPWAGKSHPNKGRKRGPDGKLYRPDTLREKFGL